MNSEKLGEKQEQDPKAKLEAEEAKDEVDSVTGSAWVKRAKDGLGLVYEDAKTASTVGFVLSRELIAGVIKIIKGKGKIGALGGFKEGIGIFFPSKEKK